MPPKIAKSLNQWLHDGGESTRRCIELVFNTLSLEIDPYMHDLILLARDTCDSYPSISKEVIRALRGREIPEVSLVTALEPGVCDEAVLLALQLISQVRIEADVVDLDNPLIAVLLKCIQAQKSLVREAALVALTSIAKGKLKVSEEAFKIAATWEEVDLLTMLEIFHLTQANLPIAVEWIVNTYYTLEESLETWRKVVIKLFRCRVEFGSRVKEQVNVAGNSRNDGLWRAIGIFEGQALKLFDVFVKNFNESRRILELFEAVHKLEIATPRIIQAVFKICNLPGIEARVQTAALNTVKRVARGATFNVSHALCIEKWTLTARLCWLSMFIDVDDPLFVLTGFGRSLMHTPHQVTTFVKDIEVMLLADDSSVQLRTYCCAAFLNIAPNSVMSPAVWRRALQDNCPVVSDLIRKTLLLSDTARISAEIVENFVAQIESNTNHELSLNFLEFFQEYHIKDVSSSTTIPSLCVCTYSFDRVD